MGAHKMLTRDNRKCIETMIYDYKSIQEIADRIGVNRTTIDRELKRVSEDLVYDAYHADMKRSTCGAKSKRTSELTYQIEYDLEAS